MDLRDYLWNIYGLRALNITVQLQPAKWTRNINDLARHRVPQLKKMTIDMAEPFVWPEVPQKKVDDLKLQQKNSEEIVKHNMASGADKNKPLEAYDGLFEEPSKTERFIPKLAKRGKFDKLHQTRSQVSNYLGL